MELAEIGIPVLAHQTISDDLDAMVDTLAAMPAKRRIVVAGEMLGAQSGLGFLIVDSRNFLRTDLIVAGMLTVGILGLGIDRLVAFAERRVRFAWGFGP